MRRQPVAHLHADAGYFFVLAEKEARVRRFRRCESMRFTKVQRQRALQPADVVPNADGGARPSEIEQRVAHDLAGPVVRQLSAPLGKHKVCAEGRQSCALRRSFGLGLAAPAGVDWLVLEEEEDVIVRRGRSALAQL